MCSQPPPLFPPGPSTTVAVFGVPNYVVSIVLHIWGPRTRAGEAEWAGRGRAGRGGAGRGQTRGHTAPSDLSTLELLERQRRSTVYTIDLVSDSAQHILKYRVYMGSR